MIRCLRDRVDALDLAPCAWLMRSRIPVTQCKRMGGRVQWDESKPSANVIGVDLAGTDLKNKHLKQLAVFKNLTTLNLTDTYVTDVGLKDIAVFRKATTLNLSDTDVTDGGLKELAALKNLTTLNLRKSEVKGCGVEGPVAVQKPHDSRSR